MKSVNSIGSRDKRPLYIQAISAITKMMDSGELPLGSQLPPEGELAELLGISRSTLREALGHLETHGMVSRQQGRGTFVSAPQGHGFLGGLERLEPFRFVAEQANKNHQVVERKVDLEQEYPEIQNELKLEEHTKFNRIQVVESIDDIRCMYLEDYLIADNFASEDMADFQGSMLTYLIENRKPPLSYSHTKIFGTCANEKVAKKLNVKIDQPILHLQEKYFDAVGDVLGFGYLYLVTEHFYFYVTRRVKPN
ncbi:MAG: GntR family transcriptional regulator [Chloroflexota bacterium]